MSTDPRFDGAGPEARWRDALGQGRFTLQACGACNHCQFPPQLVCGECGSVTLSFIDASGHGTVYSTTTVRKRDRAYNVSIIELDDGPRILTRVECDPAGVAIGEAVVARITQEGDQPIVVFDRIGGRS
ncbi:Zn-ribbon domain-containing OB-fold protein [Paracoccus sediminicola]|uniref:Zn-ribbon domain-containing OB-fold protein n=1 Tax=Paracoccus sediminicola TaxID=3017783 RepID=UPI0022F06D64|nr:OB-fold domain-containing protein [Paracoccus sediminicola]WBU56222.1 OB-fold domain-containing protein [Paracoccus sediminicola]